MYYSSLIKKRKKKLLIFIGFIYSSVIPLVPGIIMADDDKPLGYILIFLALGIIFASITYAFLVIGKITKQINEIKYREENIRLSKIEGKSSFKSINNDSIEFYSDYFMLNGKLQNYSEYSIYAATRLVKDIVPVLVLSKDKTITIIDIDGDLISTIKSCNIPVINKSDLDYHLENISLCTKIAIRKHAFNQIPCHMMEYKKNEEDKKRINKKTTISIIVSIFAFALVMALNILVIWLSNSETGNEFSNLIGLDLIIKIGFSIGILLLAFLKAKEIPLYAKIITVAYLVSYWIYVLYLDPRTNVIITLLFVGLFTFTAVKLTDLKCKPPKLSRFYIMPIFLLMLLMFNVMDMTFVNENEPFIISAIIMGVIALVAHLWMFIYLRSEKGRKLEKKEKMTYYICVPIYSIMFGFLLSWVLLVNLNYALDFSTPQEITCEIVDKTQGTDNSSDQVFVVINDKKIGISVTDSEYFDFNIGDDIIVSLYEGAFGLEYYIFE